PARLVRTHQKDPRLGLLWHPRLGYNGPRPATVRHSLAKGRTMNDARPISPRRGALYAVLLSALAVVANALAGTAAPPVPETGAQAPAANRSADPIVDSHMHVWSDQLDRFPFAHPFEPKVKPPQIAATVELLLEEMDRSGITQCVLVQTIYHGWD